MNNLPSLTERIDKGAAGGHEFERLLNQLLILFANHHDFHYEPVGGAGGDGGLDGIARDGGVPGFDGPVGFQFKWLWDDIHKSRKAIQVTDSLMRAAATFDSLRHWVLVTPRDLTPAERKWLLEQSPREDLAIHHWGQARVEGLLREHAPKLFARYFPHEAASAGMGGASIVNVIGDNNTVATKGSVAVRDGDVIGDITINISKNQKPSGKMAASKSIAAAYLDHVIRDCAPLKLKGIDQRAARPNADPLTLASVYVDLNTELRLPEKTSLADHLKSPLGKGEGMERMTERDKTRLVAALEALGCHAHLVLLGAPGSGKSTLVQYLALRLAEARQGNQKALEMLGGTWTLCAEPSKALLVR